MRQIRFKMRSFDVCGFEEMFRGEIFGGMVQKRDFWSI
jgi:hypothetical protein